MSAPYGGIPQPAEIATLRTDADHTRVVDLDETNTRFGIPVPAEIASMWSDAQESAGRPVTEPTFGEDHDPLAVYNPQLALVPGVLEREAKASTEEPTAHEKHTVRRLVVLGLAAVLVVRGLDWLAEAKGWEQKGRFDAPGFDRRMSKPFRSRLATSTTPMLADLLLVGRRNVGDALGVAYSQDQAAPVANRWARHYAGKVSEDFAATSAEALGHQVADWVNKGMPAQMMAAKARDLYGLDPRAAHAIAAATGAKGKITNRTGLIEKYLERRVEANATTWSMAAQNAGREMLFTELIEAGLLPRETRKVWLTHKDERTCPVCRPMDSVSVPLGVRFHVGGSHLMTPPVHPACRCTISVDTEPKEGFVFPKDYTMLHGWLRSATRNVFR